MEKEWYSPISSPNDELITIGENETWIKQPFIKQHLTGFAIGVMVAITFGAIWQTISLNRTVEELGQSVQSLTTISINANSRAGNNEKTLNGVVGFLNNAIKQADGNRDN